MHRQISHIRRRMIPMLGLGGPLGNAFCIGSYKSPLFSRPFGSIGTQNSPPKMLDPPLPPIYPVLKEPYIYSNGGQDLTKTGKKDAQLLNYIPSYCC